MPPDVPFEDPSICSTLFFLSYFLFYFFPFCSFLVSCLQRCSCFLLLWPCHLAAKQQFRHSSKAPSNNVQSTQLPLKPSPCGGKGSADIICIFLYQVLIKTAKKLETAAFTKALPSESLDHSIDIKNLVPCRRTWSVYPTSCTSVQCAWFLISCSTMSGGTFADFHCMPPEFAFPSTCLLSLPKNEQDTKCRRVRPLVINGRVNLSTIVPFNHETWPFIVYSCKMSTWLWLEQNLYVVIRRATTTSAIAAQTSPSRSARVNMWPDVVGKEIKANILRIRHARSIW